jgi:uncharacterized protein YraI
MLRHAAVIAVTLVLTAPPVFAQDALFTVTSPSANVHAGPSTGSPILGAAPRGRTFAVTRELGSWVRVAWPGAPNGTGYLHVTWGTVSRDDGAGTALPSEASATSVPRVSADPPTPAAATSRPPAPLEAASQRPVITPTPAGPPSLPSHNLGLGARLGTGVLGIGATARLWSHGRLGVQADLGRATETNIVAARLSTVTAGPSLVYALPDLVSNALWVRPYVGAGASLYRSTLRLSAASTPVTDTGLGSHVFGGGEFTWAGAPQLAISVDLRRVWAPTPFSGFDTEAAALGVSAHWYMR